MKQKTTTTIGLFVCDGNGKLLQISDALCTLTGHPQHALLQEHFSRLFSTQDHTLLTQKIEQLLHSGQEFEGQYGLTVPAGCRTVGIHAIAIQQMVFVSVSDITTEIDEELQQYTKILLQSPYAQILSKTDGTIIEVNQAAIQLFGFTASEIKDAGISLLIKPQNNPEILDHLAEPKAKEYIKQATIATKKNGETFVLEYASSIFKTADGTEYITTGLEDVSHYKDTLINNIPDLIWSVDKEQRLIAANQAFVQRLKIYIGYNIQPGDSLLLKDFYSESFVAFWTNLYRRALSGERLYEEVYSPAFETMPENWLEIMFNPIYENGTVIGVACYGRDITQNKQIQLRLQESKAQLEIALQIAKLGVWELGLQNKDLRLSPEALIVLGAEASEINESFECLVAQIHKEDRATFQQAFEQALNGEMMLNIEHRIVTKNQLVKTVVQKGYLLYDSNNEPYQFRAIIQDITERKYMEEALFKNQRQLDLIYNTVNEAIFLINIEEGQRFRFESVNQTFLAIIGLAKEQVIGQLIEDVIPEHSMEMVKTNYLRCVQQQETVTWEENSEFPFGTKTSVVSVMPILNEAGVCVQIIGSIHDITAIKEAAVKLEQSNERFEYATKATGDAIYDWDIERDIILWGKSYATQFSDEDSKTEFTIQQWAERVHPNDFEFVKNDLEQTLYHSNSNNWASEYRLKTIDGTYAYMIENGYIIRHDNGTPYRMIGALRDITERKQSEEKLRISEEKRSMIMNAALDAIICMDNEGRITFWNPQAAQIFGWSEAEALHKTLSSLIIPHHYRSAHDNGMKKFLATGHGPALNKILNLSALNKAGVEFPVELTVIPIKQKEEEFFCAFLRDITERKKTEDSIRISNERYNLVAKATNDYIWEWNIISNEVIRIGNGLTSLFGYENTSENAVINFWDNLVHPNDLQKIKDKQTQTFYHSQENYWEAEYRFLKANGSYAHVYDKGFIIRDQDGHPLRMIGATQDVSQQKGQINEILRIKQNLDSLINTTNDRIWSINNQYQIIASNSANNEYLYKKNGVYLNEGDLLVTTADQSEKTIEQKGYYDRALEGESFNIEDAEYDEEEQDYRYSIVSFNPIVNGNKETAGVACHAKDITEIKKSGQQLSKLNVDLQQQALELAASNAELERFAYVASHDLQEPLRMVSSFLQLLEKKYKDNIDDTGSKYIHYAVDGADRMKQLILDLLEYSRVTTSKDLITDVDMNEVVKEVLQIMDATIKELDCNIQLQALPPLKAVRRTQMLQLLQNLISNALKYHGATPCEIVIEAQEQEHHWLFKVKDNGIGFEPRFADRVFAMFHRLHNKSEYGGTGIGLSICKKIVEKHGGKIWAESEVGKGSTFYFTISK